MQGPEVLLVLLGELSCYGKGAKGKTSADGKKTRGVLGCRLRDCDHKDL